MIVLYHFQEISSRDNLATDLNDIFNSVSGNVRKPCCEKDVSDHIEKELSKRNYHFYRECGLLVPYARMFNSRFIYNNGEFQRVVYIDFLIYGYDMYNYNLYTLLEIKSKSQLEINDYRQLRDYKYTYLTYPVYLALFDDRTAKLKQFEQVRL